MNTCARHESTGAPGKIHCSKTTAEQLENRNASVKYTVVQRGLVEMKGKGKQLTYWLSGSHQNELVNEAALQQLDIEVKELLAKTDFSNSPDGHPSKAIEAKSSLVSPMQSKAMDAYIEEEVKRRVREASETTKRNIDHAEDTGLVCEVKNDRPEQPLDRAPRAAPTKQRNKLPRTMLKLFWFR